MSAKRFGIIASTVISTLCVILQPGAVHASTIEVFVPDLQPGFEYTITALALKPAASNLNYVIYNKGLPLQSPSWTEKEIKPGYHAAFAAGIRYIFLEGKDVNLTWTHLNSSTSTSISAPNNEYFLGPDYEIGPTGIPIRSASGSAKFNYDVINLDAGQRFDFGRHAEARLFFGLSNAYLKEQVKATYTGNTTGQYAGPFSTAQKVQANFYGLGPRLGFEAGYMTDSGWGLLGEAAVSALIGNSHTKTSYVSSAQQLLVVYNQQTNYQTIEDKRLTQVIPGIDTKLALRYKHAFNTCTLLTIEGGYQAAVYFNAINQYLPGSLVPGQPLETGGIFVATMSHTQSNYSVQGPFLSGSLQF